jgi:short-subunit dehydrogenase
VSCLCPGPTLSGFRARAGTDKTQLSALSKAAPSMPVAQAGYRGWQRNTRVVITGARNKAMAGLVPFLPRNTLLRIVKRIQGPR